MADLGSEETPAIETPEIIVRQVRIDLQGKDQVSVTFPPLEVDPHRLLGVTYDLFEDGRYHGQYTLVQRMSIMSDEQYADHLAAHERVRAEMQAAVFEQIEDEVGDA